MNAAGKVVVLDGQERSTHEAGRSIIDRLHAVVARNADKAFVTCEHDTGAEAVSYAELWRLAGAYGRQIRDMGVQPGDVVAIALRQSVRLYAAFVGAMRVGAIPTIIPYPTAKQDRQYFWASHAELFALTNIRAIITFAQNAAELERELGTPAFAVLIGEAVGDIPDADVPDVEARPDSVAFLQHSSGTTGLKKGVMLTHAVVLRQLDDYAARIGFTERDVIASWLPLYHDMGLLTSFLLPLVTGASVVVLDPFEWVSRPMRLLDIIERNRATFCWMPNFAFNHIRRSVRAGRTWDLSSLRAFIDCSEPCRTETFDRFADYFRGMGVPLEKLQVCYAMAETVFAVSQTTIGAVCPRITLDPHHLQREGRATLAEAGITLLSCGSVLPGCRVTVLDPAGKPVEEGLVGELAISGAYLFAGYNARAELTARKLRDGVYRTGDLGFVHRDEIYVTGRIDDLIIAYGRNYYAHEIEACLDGITGLAAGRAVALGVMDDAAGSQIVVLVAELSDPAADPRKEIKRRVMERLGLTISTVKLVQRGWLSKTTSGKISRQLNLEKYLSGLDKKELV